MSRRILNNNFLKILLGFIVLLGGCSDQSFEDEYSHPDKSKCKQTGMQRMKFSDACEIECIIQTLKQGIPITRSGIPLVFTENEDRFVSLLEANERHVMSTLTQSQLDSVHNDPDGLEFCPSDSVIADTQFALLLNANRELQVGSTVYKYYANGVAIVSEEKISALTAYEPLIKGISCDENIESNFIHITEGIDFISVPYAVRPVVPTIPGEPEPSDGGGGGSGNEPGNGNTEDQSPLTGISESNGIRLSDGTFIMENQIRYVRTTKKYQGDGNWFHKLGEFLWGINVVAIKKFSDRKQLNLNFYDQNYIVYSNIGSKLKMQKRVCGIWWNIKAQDLVHGWEPVTVKYSLPGPTLPKFVNPFSKKNDYPSHTWHPFPYGNDDVLLLTIPFADLELNTSDLNKAFDKGIRLAFDKATSSVKKLVNGDIKRTALISFNGPDVYIIDRPFSAGKKNARSMETKFYKQWFPNDYEFGFSLGSSISLSKVSLGKNDHVELKSGTVFGAVKYSDRWLGAKINFTAE